MSTCPEWRTESSHVLICTYSHRTTPRPRAAVSDDHPDRMAEMDRPDNSISQNIEVVPVVVVSQTFPARPSSIPDIRDFVRHCLAQSPLSEEDNREVGETVSQALLDAAGPTGAINVSFRIFPDHVEVDVLRSGPAPVGGRRAWTR